MFQMGNLFCILSYKIRDSPGLVESGIGIRGCPHILLVEVTETVSLYPGLGAQVVMGFPGGSKAT